LNLKKVVASIVICALSFLVARFPVFNYVAEPASVVGFVYVPMFLAMFISPLSALAAVASGALGLLFLGGTPTVIMFRAISHVTFALFGSLYISLRPEIIEIPKTAFKTSFLIAFLGALCQIAVVFPYFISSGLGEGIYSYGFFVSVILAVGFIGIIHNMFDFYLALFLWNKGRNIIFREIDW
jgi:niacin transporter